MLLCQVVVAVGAICCCPTILDHGGVEVQSVRRACSEKSTILVYPLSLAIHRLACDYVIQLPLGFFAACPCLALTLAALVELRCVYTSEAHMLAVQDESITIGSMCWPADDLCIGRKGEGNEQ